MLATLPAIARGLDAYGASMATVLAAQAHPSGVQTLSRGGSDVTGSIVAAGVVAAARAEAGGSDVGGTSPITVIYENWTDVNGVFSADPRVVPSARSLAYLSYAELQHMASAGANVLHADAVAPAAEAGVALNVCNTANPQHPGTLVVPSSDPRVARRPDHKVVGVTTRRREGEGEGAEGAEVVVVCTAPHHTEAVESVTRAALRGAGIEVDAPRPAGDDDGPLVCFTGVTESQRSAAVQVAYGAVADAGLFVEQQD